MYLAVKEVKEGLIRGDEDPSKIHPPLPGPGPGHPLKPALFYPLVSLEKPPPGIARIPLSPANK